jgi:hypothetical protein
MLIRGCRVIIRADALASGDINWKFIWMTSEILSELSLPSSKVIGLDLWNYFGNFSALGENGGVENERKETGRLDRSVECLGSRDEKPPTSI